SQGFNADAIFHQLRPNYAADISDKEIRDVIEWALCKNANKIPQQKISSKFPPCAKTHNVSPLQAVKKFLNGFECSEVDLWEASPVRLPENWRCDFLLFLETIFQPGELINIVCAFSYRGGKAN